ncbi:MAG: ABC transporter ATP-binding protein [Acholeplasmatales bacterium]|nr:ABC transporter ATP-binding protein [Acholeplasmatales bacterium]
MAVKSNQKGARKLSKDNIKVIPKLLGYLFKYYKVPMIIVIICVIICGIIGSSASIFLSSIIDDVIAPVLKEDSLLTFKDVDDKLYQILTTMCIVYGIGIISTLIYTQIMARVSQGFLNHLRKDMFTKMETLPIRYFDRNPHGDIMSRYTNDVDAVRQFISQTLIQIITTAVSIITIVSLMLYFSIWLALISFTGVFVIIRIIKSVGSNSAKHFMKMQISTGALEGYVEEMMNGQKVVKVFNHEEEAKESFDKINEQLFIDAKKANYYGNILMPILNNFGNLVYIIIAGVGFILVTKEAYNLSLATFMGQAEPILQIGVVTAFLGMSKHFSQSIAQVSQQISMIAMAMAGAGRCFELINQAPEVDNGYVTLVRCNIDENGNITETNERTGHWAWKHPHQADGTITYHELKGDIVLENVDFGYFPDKMVLHDVSVYARPGQKIAFVGATGAGKTTITNLINRFYDIADGKVRYDGININKIKKDDLRRSLGIVLQDTNLFTGTVMKNIRYGRLDATDEEVYEAAKIANAYDFITRLPNGFNTMLTHDGANLSQGQRQLLSIARAACADAPVMILDEATSSIDTRTEALVSDGMDKLMKGRTVFVIAHRLSTVRDSDCIMVLDQGRIIERGNHDSLIEEKGTYYQLYTGAFELE